LKTREATNLTPKEGIRAIIFKLLPGCPDEILIQKNGRKDKRNMDVYRINTKTAQ
jgi:hypothetical protein